MGFLRTYGGVKRKMGGIFTRGTMRAATKLGRIRIPLEDGANKKYRDPKLEMYDAYYDGRQYDHLLSWDEVNDENGAHIPVRHRKPRIIYHFPKVLCQRITSKLVGESTFPKFIVENDPFTEEYLRFIVKASKLKSRILEPIRRVLSNGSGLVRFYMIDGAIKIESYLSKYCYPEFMPNGELKSVRIQYVYSDKDDLDENGKPKEKWYKMELGQMKDVLYDNPEYEKDSEPKFNVKSVAEHNIGFVQAEWFKTADIRDSVDGYSLIGDVLDFVDELNYSLSQGSQATQYNQDPQLLINRMDEDEVDTLIRSATKAWNLGREGNAQFLESNLNGVQVAGELRDKVIKSVQDVARIVFLDPEKIVGSAQSAKAMEVLHGPMLELIEELRNPIGNCMKGLVLKMAMTNLLLIEQGAPAPVNVPPGFRPQSFDIEIQWQKVFPMTMLDLQQKVQVASSVTGANLISRETATKWLAKDFGVEDIEEELAKIESQPVINPFAGGMF